MLGGKRGSVDQRQPCGNGSSAPVSNGTLVMGDPSIDIANFNQLKKLKQANPKLKTLISVGGWSWSGRFSDMAATAKTRETFADSTVSFLRRYAFDGVDLDWEYPGGGGMAGNSSRPEDKTHFTLLLKELRAKLDAAGKADGKSYLLTIAAGIGTPYLNNTEMSKVATVVDWINVMTYDFNGDWQKTSGHNAPLYRDQAAEAANLPDAKQAYGEAAIAGFRKAGVPANKLVLGIPFYGRGWSDCGEAGNGQYKECSGPAKAAPTSNGTFTYDQLAAKYIGKNGYRRYWNENARVPYLYNASNRTFISYDDAESIRHKTAFIRSQGLAGAMFWELGGDADGKLLAGAAADLKQAATVPVPAPVAPGPVGWLAAILAWLLGHLR
ncbi:glycoside hydrolase family 18 protein [Cohnella faecalis]|uniref:glycoside hydrolase family 18 protein n=1 Tax=Cohnella faecalis TaxID=2315694 RepID=UPI001F3119A6|nr:glycoside hydrolase family 18 protein [Cohnella faecalis]